MDRKTPEKWHKSRIGPFAKWLAYFYVVWTFFFGCIWFFGEVIFEYALGEAPSIGSEYVLVAALCFCLSCQSYLAERIPRVVWNDETIRYRARFFVERVHQWSDRVAMKSVLPGQGIRLRFEPKGKMKIFTTGGFIDARDFASIGNLATKKRRENARTS